jgi:hypothetical protein
MDIKKAIAELEEERKRLDRAITRLESMVGQTGLSPQKSSRGRKTMSEEERLEVSRRMREYWAKRRLPKDG